MEGAAVHRRTRILWTALVDNVPQGLLSHCSYEGFLVTFLADSKFKAWGTREWLDSGHQYGQRMEEEVEARERVKRMSQPRMEPKSEGERE